MATAKKLDTFIIRDQFKLGPDEVLSEAQASAQRRAEVMGWSDVFVRPVEKSVTTDGPFQCYSFELWGIGAASADEGSEESSSLSQPKNDSIAAQDIQV